MPIKAHCAVSAEQSAGHARVCCGPAKDPELCLSRD